MAWTQFLVASQLMIFNVQPSERHVYAAYVAGVTAYTAPELVPVEGKVCSACGNTASMHYQVLQCGCWLCAFCFAGGPSRSCGVDDCWVPNMAEWIETGSQPGHLDYVSGYATREQIDAAVLELSTQGCLRALGPAAGAAGVVVYTYASSDESAAGVAPM